MIEGVFELAAGRLVAASVQPGTRLTDAAEAAGIILNVACGGAGTCGRCSVELVEGTFTDSAGDPVALAGKTRRVLGCRTHISAGPFRIRVPRHSLVSGGEKVLMDFEHMVGFNVSPPVRKEHLVLSQPSLADSAGDVERILRVLGERGYDHGLHAELTAIREAPFACREGKYSVTVTLAADGRGWRITRIESGDTTGRLLGLAVDLGTTTVVCSLVDLLTGRIVDSASSYNQQIRRCDDVASRISYCSSRERLSELQSLLIEHTINRLAQLLLGRHGLQPADLARVAVSGNTAMTHTFLGADPTSLGAVPFQPACSAPAPLPAGELGLLAHPAALVDVSPASAAYIGGDITSDLYVCGLHQAQQLTLLVDIGTNAEIVVGRRDHMIACAAPAGPAFEGQGLTCGLRASLGAIDSLSLAGGSARYTVIGGGKPSGLCGSALVDFLAEAFTEGLLTPAGRFDESARKSNAVRSIRTANGEETAYVLAEAQATDDGQSPIILTERDIATLLQAKAVVFAAIQIACKHAGCSLSDVQRVYLAGGFARHLNLRNCITIGLLPDIPLERYCFVGNGSLAGAVLNLVDHTAAGQLRAIAAQPEVIELNLDEDFQDAFTCAMFLPNVNVDLFPSVS